MKFGLSVRITFRYAISESHDFFVVLKKNSHFWKMHKATSLACVSQEEIGFYNVVTLIRS